MQIKLKIHTICPKNIYDDACKYIDDQSIRVKEMKSTMKCEDFDEFNRNTNSNTTLEGFVLLIHNLKNIKNTFKMKIKPFLKLDHMAELWGRESGKYNPQGPDIKRMIRKKEKQGDKFNGKYTSSWGGTEGDVVRTLDDIKNNLNSILKRERGKITGDKDKDIEIKPKRFWAVHPCYKTNEFKDEDLLFAFCIQKEYIEDLGLTLFEEWEKKGRL